jgi:hypothetical protein
MAFLETFKQSGTCPPLDSGYIHRAYGLLYADLVYGGWDGFCGNLLTMICINDQVHGKLT